MRNWNEFTLLVNIYISWNTTKFYIVKYDKQRMKLTINNDRCGYRNDFNYLSDTNSNKNNRKYLRKLKNLYLNTMLHQMNVNNNKMKRKW